MARWCISRDQISSCRRYPWLEEEEEEEQKEEEEKERGEGRS